MAICQFCRRKIDEDKIMLHEMYCERNCIKCTRCGLMYDQNDPESHEEEFHKLQQCPHCKLEFQDLNKHQCQEVPIICIYCKLEIPQRSFTTHEMQCGSRTEKCELCKQYVKMSEFQIHQTICVQKKFDKLGRGEILDDFPSLQEVKQAIVPPSFDDQYKQRQTQQKQAYHKVQTQQPIESNNVPVKSQKNESPYDQQYGILDRRGEQSKNVPTNYQKDANYYNYNYNNQTNPIPDNSRNKEPYVPDQKYNQGIKNNQSLRSTTQEVKQQYDRNQNPDQQFGNRQYNVPKFDEKQERDRKYLQDNQIQQRPNQYINNTQEVTSQNDSKSTQYSNNFKQPSNNPQQNSKFSTQSQNPQKYQQERSIQDGYDSRFPNTQDRNSNDMYQKNVYGQKYGTTQTQQISKTYQPQVQPPYLNSNQTNKYQTSYLEDNKALNRPVQQERPDVGLNSRDSRQIQNQRAPVVSKPQDIQERKQDKTNFAPPPQHPQQQQANQFSYQRNLDAHQEASYSKSSSYQKQSEYQQKYNEVSQKPSYDPKPKPQDYQQQRQFKPNQNEGNNHQFGKIFDDKPENYSPNDNSIIAKKLQESLYADDLQMTQSQIMEQQQIYQSLEENAKKSRTGQNRPHEYEHRIDRNAQMVMPNEFDFLTEEEKLIQKQLLESLELQKKRR
ncbi:unnamed protein product [Paramecium octaurelia]|uniref:SpoVT-AbrB domain-containing protein n=1 Tax=Paramecium octaurelia TaxID=43137 RepID=A0A8S1UPT1_PAROT|nr:unnamed protein product [Paramecium octaurelia]